MDTNFRLAILVSCALLLATACQGLEVGYYKTSCPRAETIVRTEVKKAVSKNAGVGAGLIRLFFHDCFVEGCDASVLLDPTPENPQPEKLGLPNKKSLRGFEVIDAAKGAVEEACPGTVSCADIVAFAGRDASYLLSDSRIDFKMPAGRLDGRRSNASDTLLFLPPPFFNVTQLVDSFAAKGLSVEDMVVLSGAHSVGRAHCSSFQGRFAAPSDIDGEFARSLLKRCPADPSKTDLNSTVNQDTVTAAALDSQYYRNVLNHKVLFTSDATLLSTRETARMVRENANTDGRWEWKFEKAMVKMGGIDVKARGHGEIRKNCRVIN